MSDELAKALAEAKKKMFPTPVLQYGNVRVIVTGSAKVSSKDAKTVINQHPLPGKGG